LARPGRRRAQAISLEDLDELREEASVERRVDDAKLLEQLNRLIERLKPVDRSALLLYLEGLTAREIDGDRFLTDVARRRKIRGSRTNESKPALPTTVSADKYLEARLREPRRGRSSACRLLSIGHRRSRADGNGHVRQYDVHRAKQWILSGAPSMSRKRAAGNKTSRDAPNRVERLGFRLDEETKDLIERAAFLSLTRACAWR
jgi:hypothetical protein